jgi:hypothetical protein
MQHGESTYLWAVRPSGAQPQLDHIGPYRAGPDPEPRETTARPAGRPTVIRPVTPRKAVSAKARKTKKPAKRAT